MNCPECTHEMEKGTIEKYPFPSSGLEIQLIDWPVWKCACGTVMPEIPQPERFKNQITRVLILLKEPLEGDGILFLRKRMGLTGTKFAEVLRVNRVEVSRWENDAVGVSPYMDFKIRMEAIERLVPNEYKERMKLAVGDVMYRLYQPEAESEPLRITAKAAASEFAFA